MSVDKDWCVAETWQNKIKYYKQKTKYNKSVYIKLVYYSIKKNEFFEIVIGYLNNRLFTLNKKKSCRRRKRLKGGGKNKVTQTKNEKKWKIQRHIHTSTR